MKYGIANLSMSRTGVVGTKGSLPAARFHSAAVANRATAFRLNGMSSFGNRILVEWRQEARLDREWGRAQALPKPKYILTCLLS